jgi:type VI secretion system protein ImpC
MCTSRFAHYLKVMARDKVGAMMEVGDVSRWLNQWIANYCVDPAGASEQIKAQRPLAQARIDVQEVKGKPGYYEAVAYLRPHFQLEALTTSMRLVAELPKKA